jgi:hypothetical protein
MPATSTPGSLPARAAILIIVCLLVALTGLWSFVLAGEMIAIGIGVLALVIAGACQRLGNTKPLRSGPLDKLQSDPLNSPQRPSRITCCLGQSCAFSKSCPDCQAGAITEGHNRINALLVDTGCHQPQDREGAWSRSATDSARPRRRGDRIEMLFAAVHEFGLRREMLAASSSLHDPWPP